MAGGPIFSSPTAARSPLFGFRHERALFPIHNKKIQPADRMRTHNASKKRRIA